MTKEVIDRPRIVKIYTGITVKAKTIVLNLDPSKKFLVANTKTLSRLANIRSKVGFKLFLRISNNVCKIRLHADIFDILTSKKGSILVTANSSDK